MREALEDAVVAVAAEALEDAQALEDAEAAAAASVAELADAADAADVDAADVFQLAWGGSGAQVAVHHGAVAAGAKPSRIVFAHCDCVCRQATI